MDFFDLVTISERTMELVNPTTPEKILKLGRFLRLQAKSRVVDLGCGYGEALAPSLAAGGTFAESDSIDPSAALG